MTGFGQRVREELAKDQTELTIPVKPNVDTAKGAKDGEEYGGAFGDAMRARIDAALKDLPKAKLDADATDADRKIDEVRTRLEELRDKRIGIDITAADALAEIAAIKADLDELGRKSPNIQVKVDALKAAADLAGVKAEVTALDGKNVNIKVDDGGSASKASNDINALWLAGISLGPAIIPVAAAVAAALAGIGTGAIAALAGIGTIKLAFNGISSALKDMDTAQQSSGKTAAQTAAQEISSANSVASAQDGVRNALRAVDDAQHQAAISAQQAAEQVANAQRSLQDAYTQAGIAMHGALEQQTQAEQQLAQAQQSAQLAQESLTAARQAAQRQIESLTLAVEDGALAERQAQLNIQQAQLQLNQTLANPQASELQRQQAQLSYDQAVQQLTDIQVRNQQNAEDKAAADAKGVEGSAQVQAAQRGVAQSTQAVANAQQSLSDAQANVAQTQQANTERIAQAQQSLADAQRSQAESARQSAESIEKAQEGVVTAQRALTGALAQQAAQQDSTSASANKLAQDMANLSPAGQQFVTFLHNEMEPKLKELQATAQQGLLPGIEDGLRAMLPIFPEINSLVAATANALGDLARRAGAALNDPFWRGFIDFIRGEAGPSINTFGTVLGNLARGAAGLVEAFKPVWDQMGAGLVSLSARFAAFGTSTGQNSGFQQFLQYVKTEGPVVVKTIGDLFVAFGDIGRALGPLGGVVLSIVDSLARLVAAIPPSWLAIIVPGIWGMYEAIKAVQLISLGLKALGFVELAAQVNIATIATKLWAITVEYAKGVAEALGLVIAAIRDGTLATTVAMYAQAAASTVVSAATSVWTGAQWLLNTALDANPIGIVIVAIGALVAAVIFCYTHFQIFRDIVSDAWNVIKTVVETVWNFTLKVIFDAIDAGLRLMGDSFNIWLNIVQAVWNGVKAVFDAMTGNWTAVQNAFSAGMDNLGNIWNRLIDIAKTPVNFVIGTVYNNGIVPVWNDIATTFGLAKLGPAALLAEGGVLAGYSPGVDSVPAILSPGEGVLVPEAVRGLGADFVHSANYYFSGGRASSSGGSFSGGGVQRFATGGIVNDIKSFIADPLGAVKSAFNSVLGVVIPGIGGLHDALAAIPGKVVDGAVNLVKGAVSKIGSYFSAAFTGSPDLQGWIMQAIQLTGVPTSWAGPLSVLIGRESGGNPNAINNWDSNAAAGHPSQGLMQTIPSTFNAYHQAGTSWNILDPVANIAAGINYIRAVYGDISNVQQANPNLPPKGYDQGGWLPPGLTLAYNGTGQPERVLTGPQFGALTNSAGRTEQPIQIHVYPRAEHSEADIADMVSRRLAFAMRANV
jgi:Transglycosylase SLT domain